MRTMEFRGVEVEYDETCVKSWKWQKAIASGYVGKSVAAIERLFCGRDEEVADKIGDDFETFTELVAAIMEDIKQGKN